MTATLLHRRIMVVEDDFILADVLCIELIEEGARVVGPCPSVEKALDVLYTERRIDAAILDVNLGGELVFPVAEALWNRNIPFVFATGYDEKDIRSRYPIAPICKKPYEFQVLHSVLLVVLN